MMKLIRKIGLFTLVLAFMATTHPIHAENNTEDFKYKNLTSKEITILQEISEDDQEFKKLIESGGEILSVSSEVKTFYDKVPTKNGGISTYSISPSTLQLTLTTSAGRYSNERVVIAHAKWLVPPLVKRKEIGRASCRERV